jgi:hypothetical protein
VIEVVDPILTVAVAAGALGIGAVGGYVVGQREDGDSSLDTSPVDQVAGTLGCPPQPHAVEDAAVTVSEAIDIVVENTDLVERGVVNPADTPVERADAVMHVADHDNLCIDQESIKSEEPETPGGPATDADPVETTPTSLENAVSEVRLRTKPETKTANRLLTHLESAADTQESKLTDILSDTVVTLNEQDALVDALDAVQPHVETDELARTLNERSARLDGDVSDSLSTIATRLSSTLEERDDIEAERNRLRDSGRRISSTAAEQTKVTFDNTAETPARLELLASWLEDGSISFADTESSLRQIAGHAQLSPKSRLGNEFVDVLTNERVDPDDCKRTLQSVVSAVDKAETMSQRLEGIDPDQLEQQAERLVDEFKAIDGPAGVALQERTADMQSTIADAGETDPVTVYAARQELRFYDRKLLPELQSPNKTSTDREDIDELAQDVEARRSELRTDYPSDYPNHNHSIPIHFLELVSTLQDMADEARGSGNDERALGYLEAANRTLDWIEELYERHAYSVLLEQLRG